MSEYLVEITPGRETVYPTTVALRAAMRGGEITPDSRIYHRAASRWLSIMEHPEYRKFLAERRPADWLEPIPFEPAGPPTRASASRALLSALGALRRRTWARVRSVVSRPSTRPAAKQVQAPHEAAPVRTSSRPLAGRRWTFLP